MKRKFVLSLDSNVKQKVAFRRGSGITELC